MADAPRVTIRPATADDTEALGRLAGSLVHLHHSFEPQRFIVFEGVEEGYGRFLASTLKDPLVVVRVAHTMELGVVGYVYARLEKRDWNRLLDDHGKIHDIVVDDRVRRRGVARLLVAEAIEGLKKLGAKRLVAETAAKNVQAQRLFASFGFGPTLIEQFKSID
ncbi:MAG: GNAT family N-acetyltransferase [Polyangiaceae bacterium]